MVYNDSSRFHVKQTTIFDQLDHSSIRGVACNLCTILLDRELRQVVRTILSRTPSVTPLDSIRPTGRIQQNRPNANQIINQHFSKQSFIRNAMSTKQIKYQFISLLLYDLKRLLCILRETFFGQGEELILLYTQNEKKKRTISCQA